MPDTLCSLWPDFGEASLLATLYSLAGFILALLLVGRLMREKRAPANTFAWVLVIVLLPWLGVPLYLLIGSRKLERIARRKSRLYPALPSAARVPAAAHASPTVLAVTAAGAPPSVGGNSVQLLATGEEAFAALERHIRAARTHIHITTFILGRDDTGRRIIRLLAERAREGVKVRLLLDCVGSFLSRGSFVGPLRAAGGEIATFMPVIPFSSRGSANLRSHRKIAVFDHATAIVGGHNLAREYLGPTPHGRRYRDLGAIISGPAAAMLNEVFIADWCFATRQAAESLHAEIPLPQLDLTRGPAECQVVASGPDVPGDPLYEGLVSMIQEAERSICIVTPYFIPDEVLLRSLIVKARAGKQVLLVTPRRSDHLIADLARVHYLRELCRAGGQVRMWTPGMLHAKAVVVDDRLALLGSANFDFRSLFVNFEIGLFLHTHPEVARVRHWAEELSARCHAYKPRQRRRRMPFAGVLEDLSRLLAPLL